MFENTILKKNDVFYKEFVSEDNKELVIIEPGYIINKQAFMIWNMMEKETSFEDLLSLVKERFPKVEEKQIYTNLNNILRSFKQRGIITVINSNEQGSLCTNDSIKTEKDLLEEYSVTAITQVDIVVTTGCNFRCRHCFIKENSYANGNKLDVVKWKEIIDKLCKQGLISVVVTGGEPMIYDQLPELLDYVDSLGLKIQLLTNGYLIDEEFVKRISKYRNIIVQVSLDGSKAESNYYQRNKEDAFEKAVESIKLLRRYNIEVIVAMVLNKKNVQDIYDGSMFSLCKSMDVKVLGISPTVISISNALKNSEDFLEVHEVLKADKFIKNYKMKEKPDFVINFSVPPALTEETSLSNIRKKRSRCRRGTNSFSVRPDGSICVCSDFIEIGYQDYELGNIFIDDFSKIINNLNRIHLDKIQRINTIKGVCSICKEVEYCGGACRADAYAKYKDIDAPYTVCQDLYESGLFPEDKINQNAEYRQIL